MEVEPVYSNQEGNVLMAYLIASNSPRPKQTVSRPPVTSYDSGYEHSPEHYVDVKLLLLDREDAEATDVPATFAIAC